jgi:hypothetical protein
MAQGLAFPLALFLLVACSGAPQHGLDVPVRVAGLAIDESSDNPVVILEELAGARRLPIWIGLAEARSIAAVLEAEEPQRPNSHDLSKRLIEGLDGRIERVVVTALRGGVYFARIDLARNGRTIEIDARPSDAIAIALRFAAPVFVDATLFEASSAEGEPAGREIHARAPERQVEVFRL